MMSAPALSERQLLDLLESGEISPDVMERSVGLSYAADRLMADHPLAPLAALSRLAASGDAETRRNVACNPATPAEVLVVLAPEFPREFFAHPLLDLMILEDPQLLTRLQPGVLKTFLNAADCPASFLGWACRHGNRGDQLEVMKRADATTEQLKAIARGSHPKAAERAINRLIELGETW